ncbi:MULTISPECIES: hypothetical protein [Ascidiaceihabitans]|uniref:EF-hand domain-containing protein n=1 Tax=Ascidiaceihabitans donghaensis TaxID=1510460 RepID=A0A2R8BDX4_9RHOB|nr:hypothetical protein [Ascidiaceihabitans donghaensis]SPH21213.1 hypothetical protein ASD8599_01962 [Ascidiaceihabitans donghaensis]
MTKFHIGTLAIFAAFASPALAQSADANGDGVLTIDEVQAVYPDVTADSFTAMDLNADGALDAEEVSAAQDAGLMPAG